MVLAIPFTGCPLLQPPSPYVTPAPEFTSMPDLPSITVGGQTTLDLSWHVTGGEGQLTWSASNVNTSMISVSFSGSLLIVTARFQVGTTSFSLNVTDDRGLSDSVQVSIGIRGSGEGESEGEGEGEGEVVACKIHGLDFSPFVEAGQNPDQGSVVSQAQVNRLVDIIAPKIEWLRTYGSCSGNQFAPPRAKQLGLSVAIGIWLSSNLTANETEITAAVNLANSGYADMLVVGTEVLYRGDLTAQQLIDYINRVRALVNVPVATADTYGNLLGNQAVMDACDVILADIYPFWEGVAVEEAVKSLDMAYRQLTAAAPGKQVLVAETGWPTDGNAIGQAVPSLANANFYFLNFVSWAKAKNVDYWYFEAFDEPWKPAKQNPWPPTLAKSIGTSWGLFTSAGLLKAGMQPVFDCETMGDNWTDNANCPQGAPLLDLTYVPPIGSSNLLEGQVCGLDPAQYAVAVYICVAGGWWNKPYYGAELTLLNFDGSWTCAIFTGGSDGSATQIAAFLVSASYSPPILGGEATIPSSIYTDAADYVVVTR